jgi:hypothetical protein
MRKIWNVFRTSLILGAKSLSEPKGFLSFLAIIVSIAAFLRSSVETTRIYLVLNEPIIVEEVFEANEDATLSPVLSGIRNFEFLIASSGQHTVFLSDLRISIFPLDPLAEVGWDCTVLLSPSKQNPSSRRVIKSFLLNAEILNEDYPYKGSRGFIVQPKDTIPFRGQIVEERDQEKIDRISTAWNANFIPMMNFNLQELLHDKTVDPAVCITGAVLVSGSAPMRFLWSSLDEPEMLFVRRETSSEMAPPLAPGGTPVPARIVTSLSVGGGLFTGQEPIFTLRTVNLLGLL